MATLSILLVPFFIIRGIGYYNEYSITEVLNGNANSILIASSVALSAIGAFFIVPLKYVALVLAYCFLQENEGSQCSTN